MFVATVKLLSRRGIHSLVQCKKYAVVPKSRADLYRRNTHNLEEVFSIRKQRVVCNDYTIRFENKYFQLEQIQPTTVFKRDKVIVQTNVDGKIVIKKKEHLLNSYLLPARPQKEMDVKLIAITRKKSDWKPPANHLWKSGSFKRREEIIINSKVGHF